MRFEITASNLALKTAVNSPYELSSLIFSISLIFQSRCSVFVVQHEGENQVLGRST